MALADWETEIIHQRERDIAELIVLRSLNGMSTSPVMFALQLHFP